jgi:hypothetical protein
MTFDTKTINTNMAACETQDFLEKTLIFIEIVTIFCQLCYLCDVKLVTFLNVGAVGLHALCVLAAIGQANVEVHVIYCTLFFCIYPG